MHFHLFNIFSLISVLLQSHNSKAQFQQDQFYGLNPNNEVYKRIYKEAVNGQIPLEMDNVHATGQMLLDLFQYNNQSLLDSTCSTRPMQSLLPSAAELSSISSFAPKQSFFFSLNPQHLTAMNRVSRLLLNPQLSSVDTLCMARILRDRPEINRHVWTRAVMNAVTRRPDLSAFPRPGLAEVLPSLMINAPAIRHAFQLNQSDTCALVDGSVGEINGDENLLWYFREDVLVNSHHWFWHLANPFSFQRLEVPPAPRPNRRGELFYYFHHSLLARYHSERLSVGLPPVVPLHIVPGTVIPEQYYAFLTDANSARDWSDRPANEPIQDLVSNRDFVNHPSNISIADRQEYLARIQQAIDTGFYRDRLGQLIPFDAFGGIDILPEMVEASIYSPNPEFYGEFGIHNDGHFLIGLIEDTQDVLRIPPAPMADGAAAMRDPAFYTYHTPIDALFESFKVKLQPYHPTQGEFPLLWSGIQFAHLQVNSVPNGNPNLLTTHWNYVTLDLSRGLDFNRTSENGTQPVLACIQHLDHQPFTYQMLINNNGQSAATASVRIFIAPRFDQNGIQYSFADQRKLFFALDYFQVALQPGQNVVTRNSVDSTLTIPWPQSLEELERDSGTRVTPFCGCGWPKHLLIPKGTEQGLVFDLFAMLTNAQDDLPRRNPNTLRQSPQCVPAPIYCGITGQLYPDTKPMGYPFDRLAYKLVESNGEIRQVLTLEEFANGIGNMIAIQIAIQHYNNANQL